MRRGAIVAIVLVVVLITGVLISMCVPCDLLFGIRRESRLFYAPNTRRDICTTSRFPAIFHQTWKTPELLDFQGANRDHWLESLRTINPDFECPLHVDADFDAYVEEHFAWFLPTWNELPEFIMKVDAIRYMWLRVQGGLYADLDLRLLQPDIIQRYMTTEYPEPTAIVTSNSTFPGAANASPVIMFSHPGHDLWLHMLEYIRDHHHEKNVLNRTGPVALSRVLRAYFRNNERTGNIKLISHSRFGITPKLFIGKRACDHSNSGLWKK